MRNELQKRDVLNNIFLRYVATRTVESAPPAS